MPKKSPGVFDALDRTDVCFSAALTLALLGLLFWRCRYGLDFTDEGYYLVWISNPWLYPFSSTQYGFIYHPLYRLVGGDIAALRQANVLITFLLGWYLCMILLKNVLGQARESRWPGWTEPVLGAALACSTLVFYYFWLPTPSYNSLALQGLMVAVTGLLLTGKSLSHSSVWGAVLVGIGGGLAFMAKPSTGAGLALFSVLYLFISGKGRIAVLAVSIAAALLALLAGALFMDGSVVAFAERLRGGVRMLSLMEGGYNAAHLVRWSNPHLHGREILVVACSTATVFGAVLCAQTRGIFCLVLGRTLGAAFVIMACLAVLGVAFPPLALRRFQGALLLAVPFGLLAAGLLRDRVRMFSRVGRSDWALAIFLAFLPYIYAFGSNNNYWETGSRAGIFWALSGLVVAGPSLSAPCLYRVVLVAGLALQLVTVVLVQGGLEKPYRQDQPLRMNNTVARVGEKGSRLLVSRAWADYLGEIREAGDASGFRRGMPMIDMTGRSPGVLFHMGAQSLGQAWMIGGYRGSERKAFEALKQVPVEKIASAWLLLEPEGPRALSPTILEHFGLKLSRDFEVVADISTPGGDYLGSRKQLLLRPVYRGNRPRDRDGGIVKDEDRQG